MTMSIYDRLVGGEDFKYFKHSDSTCAQCSRVLVCFLDLDVGPVTLAKKILCQRNHVLVTGIYHVLVRNQFRAPFFAPRPCDTLMDPEFR